MTSIQRNLAALVCLISLLVASGCGSRYIFSQGIVGSGNVETQQLDLSGFDRIRVSNSFAVEVTVGDTFFVEITADDNISERLNVKVSDRRLNLGLDNGVSIKRGTLTARIHLPELIALDVNGASSVTVGGVFGPSQSYKANGASSVTVDGTAGSLSIETSGASEFTMQGTAATVEVNASGASEVNLEVTEVKTATVGLSGASSATFSSAESVSGDLSGASELTVPRGAAVDVVASGASSINRS